MHIPAGDALGSLVPQRYEVPRPGSRSRAREEQHPQEFRNCGASFHSSFSKTKPQSPPAPSSPLLHSCPSKNVCRSGAEERFASCETENRVVMASLRWQCCNGRTSGDRRTLSKPSDRCSPGLLPKARPKGHPKTYPATATYCHYLPVSEPASLEEQVAAGHRPDLARLLQPATAPGAA